jgi:polyhydroxyalkanoate synthesis regulator phasin
MFMKNMIKKGLALGLGLAITSKEQAEKVVEELVKKGEVTQEESKGFVNELIQKGQETQKELELFINNKVQQLLGQLNLVTKVEVQRLEQQISQLEERITQMENQQAKQESE